MVTKKQRYPFVTAVHLFLFDQDKVLLLQRANSGYHDGDYSVPAGHVEAGESVLQAMARETLEEVGLQVSEADFKLVHIMHRDHQQEPHARIDFFFQVQGCKERPRNAEPEKCTQLHWATLDQLPENTIPYIRFALEQISQQQLLSYFIEPDLAHAQ